jgi:hypothetical protein
MLPATVATLSCVMDGCQEMYASSNVLSFQKGEWLPKELEKELKGVHTSQ